VEDPELAEQLPLKHARFVISSLPELHANLSLLKCLRAADFAGGAAGLNGLLQGHPGTGYRESAWYWLGNAHYGLRDYKASIDAFRTLVDRAPDHARAPEALLSISNCYAELKDNDNARKTLEQLIKQYPQTEPAQAARDRLLTMPAASSNKGRKAR